MEIPKELLSDMIKLGIKICEIGMSALVVLKVYFWQRGKYESRNKTALEGLLDQFKTQAVELKSSGKSTQAALEVTNGKLAGVHTDVEVIKAQIQPLMEIMPRTTIALERLNDFYDRQTQERAQKLETVEVAPGVSKFKEKKS